MRNLLHNYRRLWFFLRLSGLVKFGDPYFYTFISTKVSGFVEKREEKDTIINTTNGEEHTEKTRFVVRIKN